MRSSDDQLGYINSRRGCSRINWFNGQSYNSTLGPCSFGDKLSMIAATRRTASFTALTHSIVPSLQARIQSAARWKTSTKLVTSGAFALTGGDGRDG